MSTTWKWGGSWLALIGLLLVVGCGGEDPDSAEEGSPASAENGTDDTSSSDQATPPALNLPPRVLIETSLGDITVELNVEGTPITTKNFLEYVDAGYYDGTVFHQIDAGYVIQGGSEKYVIQGGSENQAYQEKPPGDFVLASHLGPEIFNEASTGLSNLRGTIAMARDPARIHSSVTKFFFNLGDNLALDHQAQDFDNVDPKRFGYCAFGRIIDGLDVLDDIGAVPVNEVDFRPSTPVVIKSITRVD